MHRAWHTYDVQQLILGFLQPQDLGRLAQTCKALSDVAIDELWKTINSFAPFLSCLPPDYRSRPLRAQDIQRLDFFASKVQNLTIDSTNIRVVIRLPPQFQPKKKQLSNDHMKSWEQLWEEINLLRPTSEFLPNLRRLRINNVVEELLIPLIGISGSNLTHIYIKYIQYRQFRSIVQKILDRFHHTPKLEYLFVRDGEPDIVPLKLIQQSPLKQLRLDPRLHAEKYWLKESPLRPEILQISTLENLTLGLSREWYGPEIKDLNSKYLPALKALWLNLTTFKTDECRLPHFSGPRAQGWGCSTDGSIDWRRPPTVFLDGLDNPELSLLNIKFPLEITGEMLLDVVSAANKSCRLRNLTTLALAGSGWCKNCGKLGMLPSPKIKPEDLRTALNMLLPMPQLKTLQLSVAPNFLDVLDLQLYKSIAEGLPNLEKLWLGHADFVVSGAYGDPIYYERVPLHHLAAFCSMLPNLIDVSVGAVDLSTLEERPRIEWTCPGVKSLKIQRWAGSENDNPGGLLGDKLGLSLDTYFPNSNLINKKILPWL